MKLGIIREEKIPRDLRTPFTPEQCALINREFAGLEAVVQPCSYRCYSNEEYLASGVKLQEDLSDCDVLMGVKEVPVQFLIPEKKYFFFSHTIKKQPHNKHLLQAVLHKKITLMDYECLTDPAGNRIIGFGRYAGIVGAYNGIMAYGIKYGAFQLKPAHLCHDKQELNEQLFRIKLPNIKIIVTGGGRVANGACEIMGLLNIRKVTPYEFLNYSFREPVYVQLHSHDFHEAKDRSIFSQFDFYNHPENFGSTFSRVNSFASNCDLLIHCSYWDPGAPMLFTKEEMADPGFRISVIADITCDINGSIPSTVKASTIDDKFYGYNPYTSEVEAPFAKNTITVMAVDNLPCELPRDSSEGFGKNLIERVLPFIAGEDVNGVIERSVIASGGKLTSRYAYLEDYVA
jgi:saccharopine dehydrogenase (NAD+, L-lysine-forming)